MDFMDLWGLGSEPPALGQEDPLEKGMATHSSILVWRIPRTEESGWLQSMGSQRVGHNSYTHRHMSTLVAQHPYVVKSFWEAIILTEYEKEKRYDTERWTSQVSSVQLISCVQLLLISCVQLFETPWTAACQDSLSITNSWSLLELISIELVMPSNRLILCHPRLFLPSIFPASGSFPVSQFFPSGGQVLEFQLQHQSFQWIFRTDFL